MPQLISTASYTPVADGVYVYVQPPTASAVPNVINGLAGIVGTASWGPTNRPVGFSDVASLLDAFGGSTGAPNEIVTEALNALDQNANFVGVRVATDDTAAVFTIMDNATPTPAVLLAFTGLYTGSRLNNATITIEPSAASTSAAPIYRVTIRVPNANPEVFDNIAAGANVAATVANIVAAINNGTSTRAPSNYVVATAGASTVVVFPYATSTTFAVTTPGTDGATVTTQQLIGTDGSAVRTGMYALRGSGVDCFVLAGCSDPTALPKMAAFAQSELAFAIGLLAGPGYAANLSGLVALQQTNNAKNTYLDTVAIWHTIRDTTTGLQRLVSPLGHHLGIVASQPPEGSPGNKPPSGLTTILSTERGQYGPYSNSDLSLLAGAGIGVVEKQMPRGGGKYGLVHGRNSGGISGQDSIAYARMTNYLVKSIFTLLGPFVDELQGSQANDRLRSKMVGVIDTFLKSLYDANRIDGYNVTSDLSNNSAASIAAGYAYMLILVKYLSEARFIIPTLQGGTTVNLTTAPAIQLAA
jgi:hypothetical protein